MTLKSSSVYSRVASLLLNTYSEQIFNKALQDLNEGISVNGERLNNIRYADDTVIFADSFQGLQELITNVTVISQ